MAERLDDNELQALLNQEISNAVKYDDDPDLKRAVDYYEGRMPDTEPRVGGSKLMSRDVADTIGWMLPGIIRVFTASDQMAEYKPVGKGDDRFAEQATDYCNHVFWKDNDGYRILWNATHDALLQKNGIVKHWWDESEVCTYSEHTGLTVEQVALLQQDGGEVVAQAPGEPQMVPQQVMGPDGQPQMVEMPVETFDIKLKRVDRKGTYRVECIDRQRFFKDSTSITLENARFCGHWDDKTRSDLIEMGFDKETVSGLPAFNAFTEGADTEPYRSGYNGHDSMTPVKLYECYYRVDIDGDGVAETIRAFIAGDGGSGELLDWEVCDDDVIFTDIPCEPVPHQFDARSIADETMDMQQVNTTLTRGLAENLYWVNLPMREAEIDSVENPEALVNPQFGGVIWRKKGSMATSAVKSLEVPFVGDKILMGLEHFSQVIEKRTGVSRSSMALDPETLQNQSATANQNQKDASYSQVELIARNMAELGWKRVFKAILKGVVKNQDRPRIIRLKDEPVEMDPRFWNSAMDVTINVGLGTGSRDRDMAMLNNILNTQTAITMQLAQGGFPDKALDMLPKVIKTATKLAESSGIKNPDEYYPDLDENELEQMKAQAMQPKTDPKVELEKAKLQMQMQLEQAKMQGAVEKERAQMLADLEVKKAEMEAQLLQEQQKLGFEREKLMAESIQKEKDREQQWQIELLKINAQAQAKQQEIGAQKEMHGEKLEHETKSKKHDSRSRQNELLIANGKDPISEEVDSSTVLKSMQELADKLAMMEATAKAPKRIVRDPTTGRASHVEIMQ